MKKKDLFDLIKTLTPLEKNLVVRHVFPHKSGNDNLLYQLYSEIEKQNVYNEAALKKIPNLSNRKRELWNKIMMALLIHETDIELVAQRRKLDYAHLLTKRQLFEQAEPLLQNVKQWSEQSEQLYVKGMALQYLAGILNHTHNSSIHQYAQALRNEMIANAEQLAIVTKAYDFYMRVSQADFSYDFIRHPTVQQDVASFLEDEAMNLPVEKMTLMAGLMYLDTKSSIYFVMRDYKKSLLFDHQAEKLFSAHSLLTPAHQHAFRAFLSNRFNLLDQAGEMKEYGETLKKYKQVVDTYFSNDQLSQCTYLTYQLWYFYRTKQLYPGHRLIQEAENYYRRNYTPELDRTFLYLQWDLIIIYFHTAQYDMAWEHCSRLINSATAEVLPSVTEFMRLFFLFILLEKQDWDYLTTRIKMYEKFLRGKDKEPYQFDLACIALLKQVKKTSGNRAERKAAFHAFIKTIKALQRAKNLYTCDVIRTFDFLRWAEAKVI